MLGLDIIQVEAGTVINCGQKRLTVDDQNCVQKDGTLFVTTATYEAIKRRSRPRHPSTNIGE
jgi:hypothetical protein